MSDSLLSESMETMQMYDKVSVDDGYGGWIPTWSPGATFPAAVVLDSSINAQEAMAAGVTGVYTVTTPRNVNLQFHDVFMRLSDGKVFRVKSDGDDKKTPRRARLDMRQVNAEEWSFPDD